MRDQQLSWSWKQEQIAAEAQLDGLYIVRTSLAQQDLGATRRSRRHSNYVVGQSQYGHNNSSLLRSRSERSVLKQAA